MKQPSLFDEVQYVKGVGPVLAQLLGKKGVRTALDLLTYFPFRYLDYRNLKTARSLVLGEFNTFVAEVVDYGTKPLRGGRRKLLEMLVKDETGIVFITWFHFNEKYLQKKFPPGTKILIAGTCQNYNGHKQFVHPDIEEWDETSHSHFAPVYPLTEGLYQKTIRRIILNTLEKYLPLLEETNLSVRESGEVKLTLKESILALHQPPEEADSRELDHVSTPWHKRVIYDELFYLQLGLLLRQKGVQKEISPVFKLKNNLVTKALSLLPFTLTKAQKKVLEEMDEDVTKNHPMNRLLQGDVGSGKTLVAYLASLRAVENGYQAAIMVPTEVLATQHYKNLKKISDELGVRLALILGSTQAREKKEICEKLKEGKIDIILGTHALIQDPVLFKNLGFIVIDEQHRFGVMQRQILKSKGVDLCPHILVMTATPIPRTLAMTVYGDLSVSTINELPTGRKPIETRLFYENRRGQLYDFLKSEIQSGHQAYFVYPLIEESEKSDLKDAVTMMKNIQEVFKNVEVGLLHGKMKPSEKEAVMKRFKENEIKILVSTTVIEVGVDVPNATVMVIEHAERFGLSQLHQLRGRVGRGASKSYCFLIAGYAQSEETRFRLRLMEETSDGFKLAEEDLKIRGPGDFLGTRQSGLPEFRLSHLTRDENLLTMARTRAQEIVEKDPSLQLPEYGLMKKILKERWEGKLDLGNIL